MNRLNVRDEKGLVPLKVEDIKTMETDRHIDLVETQYFTFAHPPGVFALESGEGIGPVTILMRHTVLSTRGGRTPSSFFTPSPGCPRGRSP